VAVSQVAIVGRPNVGKSSLFNWLAGRRIAIVDPTPGVTRDRLTAPVQADGRFFELVDTGGMGIEDVDQLTKDVERQIASAIDLADVILFVVDARSGLVPLDEEVARRLRPVTKPVLLVANKCDSEQMEAHATEFAQLGYGNPLPVSALQNRNKEALLDRILRRLPKVDTSPEPEEETPLKLAIVGRRNTGKSTFINSLAKAPRVIVSEVPGTTRDSVDVHIERDGKKIIAIDTAGVRKKGKIHDNVEFYSVARAERSIRRADVVLQFFDAPLKISMVDKQLAGYVLEHHKPAIFVVNKWDLLKAELATGQFGDYLRKVFPSLDFVPIAFITAKDNRNVDRVLNLARNLHKQASSRVGTGDLNRVVRFALEQQSPPMRQNRRPKIYYATQAATNPPTIVLFTNAPDLFDNTYRRYLLKTLRDHLPFRDVAIKMYLRPKRREDREGDAPELSAASAAPRPARERQKPKASAKGKRAAKVEPELWKDL
jgi:GTP-binding protein